MRQGDASLMKKKTPQKHRKALAAGIFILATLLMFVPLFAKSVLSHFESLGLVSIFFINFISSATIFLPTPGIVSVAVGGNLYNPLAVAFLAAAGSALGEGVGFLFGYSSKEILNHKRHKLFFHLFHFIFKKYATYIIPLVAFIPNPLIDGLGIFAGMADYPPRKYLFLVFLGRLARNILIAYAGFMLK